MSLFFNAEAAATALLSASRQRYECAAAATAAALKLGRPRPLAAPTRVVVASLLPSGLWRFGPCPAPLCSEWRSGESVDAEPRGDKDASVRTPPGEGALPPTRRDAVSDAASAASGDTGAAPPAPEG